MDLVKSHLMSAVRSEVEELRDKISKLEESVTVLSRENELLRANVNPDILANLSGSTTSRHHQIQQPPDWGPLVNLSLRTSLHNQHQISQLGTALPP